MKTKLLHALYLNALPLAVHCEFFKKLVALLAAAGDDLKEAVAALLPPLNTALAKEEALLQWINKSILTQKIADAVAELNRIIVGINAIVQTGLHSNMSAIRESGERVHIMMKDYGNIRSEDYNEKAADIRQLLIQFAGPYAQDAANLGMAMWVQQLQTALTTFNSLVRQREDQQIDKPDYTAEEVRKEIDGVYHPMMDIIEAGAVLGASTDFAPFIEHLNPDIDQLNEAYHRAKKDLSQPGCTLIAPIGTQEYTGNPVTPLSDVYYTPPADEEEDDSGSDDDKKKNRPTERLFLGKDYSVTYKNNIKVGQAQLTLHGKGDYKGQKSATFYIARKPFPTGVESGELKVEN